MWIWLDRFGKVKEYLTHGCSPVVGDTTFQIFVHFDGVDINALGAATIRLRKPDRQRTAYPALFMKKTVEEYEPYPEDSVDSRFRAQSHWTGFMFDFSDFLAGDIVRLLDTPGMWEATISVIMADNPSKVMASGLITFEVGGAVSEDEEEQSDVGIGQLIENLNMHLIANYVPYSGANKNVDVGEHEVIAHSSEDSGRTVAFTGDGIIIRQEAEQEGEEDTEHVLEIPNKDGTLATLEDLPSQENVVTAEEDDYVIPPEDR